MSNPVIARRIGEILPDAAVDPGMVITGIQVDSRRVVPGDAFFAVPGPVTDGRRFIDQAIAAGAAVVLFEADGSWRPEPRGIPQVPVPHLGRRLGEIAGRFFDEPSLALRVIAVTGTNGKTSCTHFIAALLSALGQPCAVIGTLGFGPVTAPVDFGLTTPGAVDMQRILHRLRVENFSAVAMEASSHGLVQGRFNGTAVDVAVLTNLTRDHLDFHESMDAYKAAKRVLFELPGVAVAVLNQDDDFGAELASTLRSVPSILTYSLNDRAAALHCSRIELTSEGATAELVTPWGEGVLRSGLLGRFNLSNLLAVVAVLGSSGFALDEILRAAEGVQTVRGRMERIPVPGRADVVIDYAHTPDALEQTLRALREHCAGRLWCVFGCGGDRDRGKRPQMGAIAQRLADRVVLTDDNPRGEDPRAIIADILDGMTASERVQVVPDRATAIRHALREASPGDVVLLAGKGHESYQEVGGKRLPFSDHAVVLDVMERAGAAGEVRT